MYWWLNGNDIQTRSIIYHPKWQITTSSISLLFQHSVGRPLNCFAVLTLTNEKSEMEKRAECGGLSTGYSWIRKRWAAKKTTRNQTISASWRAHRSLLLRPALPANNDFYSTHLYTHVCGVLASAALKEKWLGTGSKWHPKYHLETLPAPPETTFWHSSAGVEVPVDHSMMAICGHSNVS